MPTRSDRCRRRVTPRRVCDQCFEATGGVRAYLIGKLYRETKKEQCGTGANQFTAEQRGNYFPSAKTAERIAEQFNVSDRETKVTDTFKGNQYTMGRGNNFPLPKTAERIGERSTSLTGRETKKAPSGRADREFGGQIVCPPKLPSVSPSSSTSPNGPGDEERAHRYTHSECPDSKLFANGKHRRPHFHHMAFLPADIARVIVGE